MRPLTTEQQEFLLRHWKLCWIAAHKVLAPPNIDRRDIVAELVIYMAKAIPSYDRSKARPELIPSRGDFEPGFVVYITPGLTREARDIVTRMKAPVTLPRIKELMKHLARRAKGIHTVIEYQDAARRVLSPTFVDVDRVSLPKFWDGSESWRADKAMAPLDARERSVVRMAFEMDMTNVDIGERLGVSRERARQLLERALWKMRAHLKADMARKRFEHRRAA